MYDVAEPDPSLVREVPNRQPRSELERLPFDVLEQLTTDCLALLPPGRQKKEIFAQLARIWVMPTIELVPLRPRKKSLDVLLHQRPASDIWWPGQWALPGAVLTTVDEVELHDFTTPARGLIEADFQDQVRLKGEVSAVDVQRRITERGNDLVVLCMAEVEATSCEDSVTNGNFFGLEWLMEHDPPGGLVEGHRENVALAHRAYLAHQAGLRQTA